MEQMKMKEEQEEENIKQSAKKPKIEDTHSFFFSCDSKTYHVTCEKSMTVLEALLKNSSFRRFQEKNTGKEVVIQRENPPRGAVNTDFPCCLINKDELLNITFIKSSGSTNGGQPVNRKRYETGTGTSKQEEYVVFNIKTKGGKNIKRLMKNPKLSLAVDYVCVSAIKGETIRRALKRDSRFLDLVFENHCALSEMGSQARNNMSNTVDHLGEKEFEVIIIDKCPKIITKPIPNTEEIRKLLRDQFGGLLKTLKERENFTKPAEVQKFYRQEFDKSSQSFSEVKRVKQLMELSDFVCQIRVEGSAYGTGFLLFDKFILTNAHVVKALNQITHVLQHPVTAVFQFEDLDELGIKVPVKENLVAHCYGKNDKGLHLDFALLELSDSAEFDQLCLQKRPQLLNNYSPPSIKGGICIVGHPDGGVKRMDTCFIIEKDQVLNEANKHLVENPDVFLVFSKQFLDNKWDIDECQISYNSCFSHGSSGSPVFNEFCQLIGVHTGGYFHKGERGKNRSVIEFAFPMRPILVTIIRQCRERGRSEIVQYFETHNMTDVLQEANDLDQRNVSLKSDDDKMEVDTPQ